MRPMDEKPEPTNDPTPQRTPGDGADTSTSEQVPMLPPQPPAGASAAGGAQSAPPRQRFTERLWSLRSVVAVAVAAVLVGGVGGAALASIRNHDGQDGRSGPGHGHFGPAPGQMRGPGIQQRREQPQFGQQDRQQGGQPAPPSAPATPSAPASPGATS